MPRTPIVPDAILSLLSSHHLLSAVEIIEKLKRSHPSLHKTTVYRAIDKLLADDLICRNALGSETLFYELRSEHHDHAVCEKCGSVTILSCDTNMHLPMKKRGFRPTHHHMTVFGVCQKCV